MPPRKKTKFFGLRGLVGLPRARCVRFRDRLFRQRAILEPVIAFHGQLRGYRQECLCYSERRAVRGSMLEARRAGIARDRGDSQKQDPKQRRWLEGRWIVRPKSMVALRQQQEC